MLRVFAIFLLCAAAQAATLNVTISVTGSLASAASGFTVSGNATLSGGITDTGTFSATIPTSALESTGNATIPYNMTLKQGTMAGNLVFPIASIIESGTGSGTMSVTSASGSYSGDTGTFNVTGSGSIGATGLGVTFNGSGTITTGGTVTAPPPTITAVQDAASYTSNIAQGSIFVVKGSNLSASGLTSLNFPLPPSSGGTSITFTPAAGGTGTQAYMIYTYLENGVNQLAAVLPSTVAPGNYNVTVTYNQVTSAPMSVQVVAAKPEIITQDSTGNGLAAAQVLPNYTLVRLTTGTVAGTAIEPAHPGDTVVVYGTGLGPVPFADNVAVTAAYTFPNVQAIVGGTSITPVYAGRTPGASGLDQVAFTLPSSITTGCAVTLQISESGTTSAATTLSIAPAGATACVYPGLTTVQLQNLDQGGTIAEGGFDLTGSKTTASGQTINEATIGGAFYQLTGFELSSATSAGTTQSFSGSYNTTTIGSCTVTTVMVTGAGSTSPTVVAGGVLADLDAGKVTINGPSGSNISNEALNESSTYGYSLTLGETGITGLSGPNGTIVAGTYMLTGAGGKDVGPFSTSITLSPIVVTGSLPTSIPESSPLTINWTGGNSPDVVEIVGFSSVTSGTGANFSETFGEFICTTTAGTGGFTVPSAVLTLLPKSNSGELSVSSSGSSVPFTPSLTAGGTVSSIFLGGTSTGSQAAYQ